VLAAGTFANVVMTVLFLGVMALFFTILFVPVGVKFNTYAITPVNLESVNILGNSSIEGYLEIEAIGQGDLGELGYTQLTPDDVERLEKKYYIREGDLQFAADNSLTVLYAIYDSPAVRAQIAGAITEIDGETISSYERFSEILLSHSPGDEVNLKTAILDPGRGSVAETKEYDITLGDNHGNAFLGVGFLPNGRGGFMGYIIDNFYYSIKDPFIHYQSEIGELGWFIFYLLWWIIVINILVALFNMLPLGILDGGRFFYLTVLGITGRETWSKKAFSIATWLLLLMFLAMMIKWVFRFF